MNAYAELKVNARKSIDDFANKNATHNLDRTHLEAQHPPWNVEKYWQLLF